MKKKVDLLNGNIIHSLIKMSFPLMLINLINVFYALADTYFIGQIDQLQVGAISLVSTISSCGNAFATGLGAAGMAIIAKNIGLNNKEKANHVATLLIELAFMLGILFAIFMIIFANPILTALNTPSDIYQSSYNYLIGLAFDYVFLFNITIFQIIRQSNGDSKTGVYINIVAAILNIILDPIFISIFKLGTLGAALATTLSKGLMTPITLIILLKDKNNTYIDFKHYKFKLDLFLEIFKLATPSALGYFLQEFGFVMMNRFITSYGSIVMAGYGIGNKLSNIFYIPSNAVSASLTPFIGQNFGAKQYDRMEKCYSKAMLLITIISVIALPLSLFTLRPLTILFVKNASVELITISCEYAYYSVGTIIFMGWFNNLMAFFNGVGYTKLSLIINSSRLWLLRIPLFFLFERFTNLGYVGLWICMIISNLLVCLIGQSIKQFYLKKQILINSH